MELKIVENDAGQRLDRFLRKAFKATPLSLIHKALRKGKVKVNGKKGKPDCQLSVGDTIYTSDIDFKRLETMAEKVDSLSKDLTSLILYEDDRYLIINKPVGLPVHSGAFHAEDTLIDLIKKYIGKTDDSLSFVPSLAHRLDKGVSGVIVAAKSADSLRIVTELFRENEVRKEYLAIVSGEIFADEGQIDKPIPDKKGNMLPSLTKWKVVERLDGYTFLRVRLFTGRMHQIRRHLSGEGFPIVGDTEYGGKKAFRIMLHSHRIEFFDSVMRQKIIAEAEIPAEMSSFIQRNRITSA